MTTDPNIQGAPATSPPTNPKPWAWQRVRQGWRLVDRDGRIALGPAPAEKGGLTLYAQDPKFNYPLEMNPEHPDMQLIEAAWLLPELAEATQAVIDALPASTDRYQQDRIVRLQAALAQLPLAARPAERQQPAEMEETLDR